jgi:filamentous hemagglutinin family protein
MTISTLLTRSLAIALLFPLATPNVLLAQVTPANDGTGTVVNTNGNQFNIEGGTLSENGANLFHSLEKLGLNRDQIANFLANPQVQNILTRVVGGDASIINGLIQVAGGNANLYLMNPAGVIFGPNAMINVPGDFVVTTATGIGFGNDQWFNAVGSNDYQTLVGNPSQFAFDLANPGAIFNGGNLSVGEGKNISLIGGTVMNTGTISAPGGDITIAAIPGTSRVKISKAGNLVSLEVKLSLNPDKSKKFNPLDLPTLLTKGSILPENTETNLAQGSVITEGAISAAGTQGGQVALIGQQVSVSKGLIDVSGVNGGGTVRVGGDYQGKGSIPNAAKTLVDGTSQIKADGLGQGDGGRVIVWADGNTQFDGKISAKGGLLGGDGGFVEVSGKEKLSFNGLVDLSANKGNLGTLLLDPTDIKIYRSPDTGDIDASSLESTSGNVVVNADNNITIAPNVSLNFVNGSGSITFTADADKNNVGNFLMDTNQSITASGRNLTISGNSITLGNINTHIVNGVGGNVTLTANNNIQTGNIETWVNDGSGGNVNIALTGSNGSITTGNIRSLTFDNGSGGNVDINANGGGITTGLIDSYANRSSQRGGDIKLTNAKTIAIGDINDDPSTGFTNLDANGGEIVLGAINDISIGNIRYKNSNISLNGPVTLSKDTNITIFGTGGQISFANTVNGSKALTINNSGTTVFNSTVNTATLTTDTAGSTQINGNITTTGNQTYNDVVTLTGDRVLTGDEINFNGTVSGSGSLTLQPFTTNRNIAIGTADNSNTNQLNLTTSEINNLQNGFNSITIGRSDSSGAINVAGTVTFNAPVTLRSPSGLININNTITGQDASITLQGTTNLNANLTTNNQNITIDSNIYSPLRIQDVQ